MERKERSLSFHFIENEIDDNDNAWETVGATKSKNSIKTRTAVNDHLFVIKSIVNKYVRSLRKSLYCCFIDFSKAFHSVWRDAMFYKLLSINVKLIL